ncbi:MAG: AAA family ATPase [Candidatus Sedimenticola sp. (ex Thyasira tokunagai)]
MIMLIGSQKGGCGKSTIAVNICAYLVRQEKDIVLVDADRQGTASNWASDRANNSLPLPLVNCVQRYDNIRETLLDLDKRYEYVIVDAAGRDSRELRTGMTAADLLVVPFRPSQPDLDTLPKLVDIATQARDINENLQCKAVLTMAPTNPVISEVTEGREYLASYPELMLLETTIFDRKVYRDTMCDGFGVVEMGNQKAKDEIKNLVEELICG